MPAFISHSSKDEAVYTALCLALDAAAIERWDPKSMSMGESLSEQLQAAIRRCEVCVLIATRHSVDSKWCLAELGAFWGAGKKVVMFMADYDLAESMLPPQFKGTLRADDASNLIASIRKEINNYHCLEAAAKAFPSREETTIRLFYDSISQGIGGDDVGWERAWDQCSEAQKDSFRNYRRDVPSDAPPAVVLKPLYQDSSIHDILYIGAKEQVSPSQSVYFVFYKERKGVLINRIHSEFIENRKITMGDFFENFTNNLEICKFFVENMGQYYDFKSTAESYASLNPDNIKEKIINELQGVSIKRLFGGNLIYELGTFFHLKRKEMRKAPHRRDRTLNLYDIGYVFEIHLELISGKWKITRFEQISTFYVDVSR